MNRLELSLASCSDHSLYCKEISNTERLTWFPTPTNSETFADSFFRSKHRPAFNLEAYHTSRATRNHLSGSTSCDMSSPLSNGLLTQSTIYKGIWINWSQGYMRGATLTTTTTSGAILVAFLALFVQFTGTHLWGISRFTIHQIRVSKTPRDGLYHQQQVILRNFSPADAATALVQVGWQWRSRIRNPARRSLPLALVPLAHSIVFLLAAILSATASSSQGNEVLVSSPYCGLINYGTPNLTAVVNILNSYETQSLSDSASYARSCYASEGTGRTWQDCSTFPASRLPVIQTNTSCPFEADICTAPSIQLDTGLMDSDLSFGMNAPPSNRVKFRKVTSCAPIEVREF